MYTLAVVITVFLYLAFFLGALKLGKYMAKKNVGVLASNIVFIIYVIPVGLLLFTVLSIIY